MAWKGVRTPGMRPAPALATGAAIPSLRHPRAEREQRERVDPRIHSGTVRPTADGPSARYRRDMTGCVCWRRRAVSRHEVVAVLVLPRRPTAVMFRIGS